MRFVDASLSSYYVNSSYGVLGAALSALPSDVFLPGLKKVDLGDLDTPNDPVFWLILANADRLWAQQQAAHGYLDDFSSTYVVSQGRFANLTDVLQPFGVAVSEVWSTTALCYQYAPSPIIASTVAVVPAVVYPQPVIVGNRPIYRIYAVQGEDEDSKEADRNNSNTFKGKDAKKGKKTVF